MRAIAWSEHLLAVQLAEWIGDKLEAGGVGGIEVQRGFAGFILPPPRGPQPGAQAVPLLRLDADCDVMQPAEHLLVRTEVEIGEIKEAHEVTVADVEEKSAKSRDSRGSRTTRSVETRVDPGKSGWCARRRCLLVRKCTGSKNFEPAS